MGILFYECTGVCFEESIHMHELSIADSLIETAASHIPKDHFLQGVHLTIGALSGVCAESLEFCFSIVAREKGHEAARLIIKSVPASFKCLSCHKEYVTASVYQPCPFCDSMERDLLEGEQFTIDAIDVENKNHV